MLPHMQFIACNEPEIYSELAVEILEGWYK